jgi:phosphatidylserine/phosphatidylglycerophosphate/cardiolipin synthase-like enzyme
MMFWIEIATGFTGALTLVFLVRAAARSLGLIPTASAHFSPAGGCQEAILRELKRARREVLVQAYSFTADALTLALVEAKQRGVNVEILLDRSSEQERASELRVFLDQGLAPLIDSGHASAHNKVMIIDQKTVITGSYNFTNQAEEENAENLLILRGHAELATAYRENFLAHKAHSKPAQAAAPAKKAA